MKMFCLKLETYLRMAGLRGHGTGRHSDDEIFAIGCCDIDSLADFLADQAGRRRTRASSCAASKPDGWRRVN
jgi:hypothetical protein